MIAAVSPYGVAGVAVLAVVAYAISRLLRWIWAWLDQSIIVSSWGILLEGLNDAELERKLRQMIRSELEQTGIGRLNPLSDAPILGWRGIRAKSGTYPMGQDLYVSWNLLSRTNPLLRPKKTFGVDETNEMQAFASATLAAVQRALQDFLLPQGTRLPANRLAPSGILGELPGAVNKTDSTTERTPEPEFQPDTS